ncbi:hypothetical protein [Bacteroides stercoris]|jgi:hypothetical protein|nr:hypothetical protein [Bacteroides stercoris]MDC2314695.1 hypothetical protein [Bacteroides stercoris]MDC2317825.1 hypothetical protein [Bacteroides stercoris]MDC2320916.1 hypothetical protein [Bacteroides stercoris]MDC2327401.1 hypothetical protein [Bacteroides stercoris]MDC2330616.1 hypothetical protein [Bacteroides stercoris]
MNEKKVHGNLAGFDAPSLFYIAIPFSGIRKMPTFAVKKNKIPLFGISY